MEKNKKIIWLIISTIIAAAGFILIVVSLYNKMQNPIYLIAAVACIVVSNVIIRVVNRK